MAGNPTGPMVPLATTRPAPSPGRRCLAWLANVARTVWPPLLLLVVVWQAVAFGIQQTRGVHFPGPWQTVLRLIDLLGGTALLDAPIYVHLGNSLARWGCGFTLGVLGGLACGLIAGSSRWGGRLLLPNIQLLQLIPGLAWIPLALLLFGIGPRATVFMIAATALPPIALSVVGGMRHVDPSYVRAARMMGASRMTLLFRVLLPAALPQVLTGLRVGLGNGWRVLVAGEMIVGTGTGLGYAILQTRWTQDYTSAFACIAIIGGLGLAVERGVFGPAEHAIRRRWGRLGEE